MGGTNFERKTSLRRLRADRSEKVDTNVVSRLSAKRCVGRNTAIVVDKPANAKGSFLTATLKRDTYELKCQMGCCALTELLSRMHLTHLRNGRLGFFRGVRRLSLLVVSSFKVGGLRNRRRGSFRRVVSSHCRGGSLVLSDRLTISS